MKKATELRSRQRMRSKEEGAQEAKVRAGPTEAMPGNQTLTLRRPNNGLAPSVTPSKSPVSSIEDIIKRHSPAVAKPVYDARAKARKELGISVPLPMASVLSIESDPTTASCSTYVNRPQVTPSDPPRIPTASAPGQSHAHPPDPGADMGSDSLDLNLLAGQALLERLETMSTTSSTTHSTTRPSRSSTRMSISTEGSTRSKRMSTPVSILDQETYTMARYLRSPDLNRYLVLRRSFPSKPLHISLADIGARDGVPLVFFLGLGCVRHLIAMYEALAKALNIRMICIDRWGYGKSDNVSREKRTPLEWASVVDEVLKEIGVRKFGILAHSAGEPYATAVALRMPDRVLGNIHFLAPWISHEIDGGE